MEDQAQPVVLPLCREKTGGKDVPGGHPAQQVAGRWLTLLQCNEHTATETGRLCKTQLHLEKRAGVGCYLHGKDFSSHCPCHPLKALSKPDLHEQPRLTLWHAPRTGQMLSPGLHVEPLVDQRTEPSPQLSPLQPDQPCSRLCPAISHIDCFLVSFSEGPITIIVSHPLRKL